MSTTTGMVTVPKLTAYKNDEAQGPCGDVPIIAVLLPIKGLSLAKTRDILVNRWNAASDVGRIISAVLAGQIDDEIVQLCGDYLGKLDETT